MPEMADKIVEVPGVGNVSFPGGMADAAISEAIQGHLTKQNAVIDRMQAENPERLPYYGFTPGNVIKNALEGAKGLATGTYALGKDLVQNPNWISGPNSTAQKFVYGPSEQETVKAGEALKSGHTLPAVGHAVASAIPFVGPWAASLGEQAGTGDIGGATGQAAGTAGALKVAAMLGDPEARAAIARGAGTGMESAGQWLQGGPSRHVPFVGNVPGRAGFAGGMAGALLASKLGGGFVGDVIGANIGAGLGNAGARGLESIGATLRGLGTPEEAPTYGPFPQTPYQRAQAAQANPPAPAPLPVPPPTVTSELIPEKALGEGRTIQAQPSPTSSPKLLPPAGAIQMPGVYEPPQLPEWPVPAQIEQTLKGSSRGLWNAPMRGLDESSMPWAEMTTDQKVNALESGKGPIPTGWENTYQQRKADLAAKLSGQSTQQAEPDLSALLKESLKQVALKRAAGGAR